MDPELELARSIKGIQSKEDLSEFVTGLLNDLETNRDAWENPTLESFLEAVSRWIQDMDGYYINMGQEVPVQPTWNTLADILYAAKIYE